MSFKNFIRDIQELKGGIGSISRRSFELRLSHLRSRSQSIVVTETQLKDDALDQSCWVNIPPELLRDVIHRVESSENSWPSRRNVLACAAVCSTWREITKELVKAVELSGKITFPISLKQPGPRETVMQCYIKRDRTTASYLLYLGLSPTPSENGKFLLAARKFRRATSTDYIISLDSEDMSRGSNTYVGKLRSNFLGTKFTVYDSQPPHNGAVVSVNRASRRVGSKQVSPRVPAGSYNVAHITYELNMMGARGPRRMQCTLHSIPAAAMERGGTAPTPTEFVTTTDASTSPLVLSPKSTSFVSDDSSELFINSPHSKDSPLVLKNKSPRWHEQLQCWCLNFRGRVTVASVKNFQLVAAVDPTQNVSQGDQDKVLLQFGKIGKDIFTMDYCYPLSTFQAFAISLSSFDTKLACE
ncbi:hypothetical protein O6H91_03G135400 [Diphasiastrum complanatum]|uniref:Uncharacterized protein n=2 Tax=Diphasiastrum complanatum TaxID=34168 RepID=A0ACC2EC87_DIPCM|nr:hypothetical protein O6H91_03G135400 [Diphasiastrum complanatum]KAJ7564073.1 hypothetical protein O6H91_03G135400 [Diphasiastrum complanatum]